jgi:hypothetical protein
MSRRIVSLAIALAACGEVESRRPLAWAGEGAGFGPTHLAVPDDDGALSLSMTPVTYTHRVTSFDAEVGARPHVAESREWTMTLSGGQLRAGLALPTTTSGALVELRRAPLGQLEGPPLGASPLRLRTPDGDTLEAGEASWTLLSGDDLAIVHPSLGGDAIAFRLDPDLGSGTFAIALDEAPADAVYGVRVQERDSPFILRLQTDRETYLHGDIVHVHASLISGQTPVTTDRLAAFVRAPDGSAWPLELVAVGPGRYEAQHEMKSLTPTPGGLWTVQASVGIDLEAGVPVRRTAHTAFGYAVPTARLSGVVDIDVDARGGIVAELPVEIAAEGRYAIAGTLREADGDADAAGLLSQSALHLTPGDHSIRIVFDADAVAEADLSPPFVVRDLRLLDQSRVALLQHHTEAFTIPAELMGS